MNETQAQAAPGNGADELDTFPKLLEDLARRRPDRPAIRENDYGIWQTWTWGQVAEEVRALACGLAAIGLKRGDKIAIIGDNRPRLYWTMTAAQVLGAVPVPLYQDAVIDEMVYVVDHAEVSFAMAEDQEQVDKMLELRRRGPRSGTVESSQPAPGFKPNSLYFCSSWPPGRCGIPGRRP